MIHLGEHSPTNISAIQSDLDIVLVSWTPSGGERYRLTADPGGVSIDTSLSPQAITIQPPGIYNISVMLISQHYRGTAGPVEVTVRGESG